MRPLRSLVNASVLACLCCSVWTPNGHNLAADDGIESSSVIPIRRSTINEQELSLTVETIEEGTSSRRVRSAAIEQFPIQKLTPHGQQSAMGILDDLTLFRRLPVIEFEADPQVYDFFADRPDVAVSIWRAMDISKVELDRKSPTLFETNTNDGTQGTVEVLLRDSENYIVMCRGEFKSPALSSPIQAVAMMHLRPTFTPKGVRHQVDLYVSLPSDAIALIAKLISPISNRIADRNFEEISLFVKMMSVAMTRQPGWVEAVASRLEGVSEEDRGALLQTTAEVYVNACREEQRATGAAPTLEGILPPQITEAKP
ncbi:hypothetical protein AB1L42_11200 [Thalassoglobus sp. JC818]|uniref:hypothetical protein n=1 Tax=Thalassoglobus sp. JC818 TaxID=3232136 RepID=UPI00345A620E